MGNKLDMDVKKIKKHKFYTILLIISLDNYN